MSSNVCNYVMELGIQLQDYEIMPCLISMSSSRDMQPFALHSTGPSITCKVSTAIMSRAEVEAEQDNVEVRCISACIVLSCQAAALLGLWVLY